MKPKQQDHNTMRQHALIIALAASLAAPVAVAAPAFWTDWTGSDLDSGPGFVGQGTITTPTSTVTVTYTNAQGIYAYQANGGIDYYVNGTDGPSGTSPFTSSAVDNRPTGTDIVMLQYAGTQTLRFSVAIANPVFAYVSLNGNGYAFDQDFDILSYGGTGGNLPGDNACGYWGCGTSSKQVVVNALGQTEYQLVGTGEPHGTLRFRGAFDTVTWRSLSNEAWNGFTVGVQGTAAEVFQTPEPTALALVALGLLAAGANSKRRRSTD